MAVPEEKPKEWTLGQVLRHLQDGIVSHNRSLVEEARQSEEGRLNLQRLIAAALVREDIRLEGWTRQRLVEELAHDMAGFGPITPLLADGTVSEVMVNGPDQVYVERAGQIERTGVRFRDREHLEELIRRLVAPMGRRIDLSSPYVEARMADGSRVHAVLSPVAVDGPYLTIRRFGSRPFTAEQMVQAGTLSAAMLHFLSLAVRARLNILISGGTGVGKTTLLNVLAGFIAPLEERVLTIEDAAELCLAHPHVVRLEARPANLEGKGAIGLRELVRNALRMRPDRLILGEVRGAEAFDLIQALNTGHAGSLSTIHANRAPDAVWRLVNLALLAGENVPYAVARDETLHSLDLVIQMGRLAGGVRKITEIAAIDPDSEGQPVRLIAGLMPPVQAEKDLRPGKTWVDAGFYHGLSGWPERLRERLVAAGISATPAEIWQDGEPYALVG